VESQAPQFAAARKGASGQAPFHFCGGEGEIRTHEGCETLPVFKTGAFNRSATSPAGCGAILPDKIWLCPVAKPLNRRYLALYPPEPAKSAPYGVLK
jgi:hypothetical protein